MPPDFENGAIAGMQSAVIAACSEAFEHLTAENPRLEITFTRFPDRMEVALTHRGEGSPAVGLDTIAGFAARIGGNRFQPRHFRRLRSRPVRNARWGSNHSPDQVSRQGPSTIQ